MDMIFINMNVICNDKFLKILLLRLKVIFYLSRIFLVILQKNNLFQESLDVIYTLIIFTFTFLLYLPKGLLSS